MLLAKSSLAIALLGSGVLAVGVAAFSVRSADRPYDDWDAFGHALGPRRLVVPADITVPDTDAGLPFVERPFDVPQSRVSKDDLVELFLTDGSFSEVWPTTTIMVSKTAIRVASSDLTIPLPAQADGLYLRPLALALRWSAEHFEALATAAGTHWIPTATLIIDRDVPYRVLEQVAWTVGQSECGSRHVARCKGQLVAVVHPRLDHWPPGLRVKVTSDGFIVRPRGEPVEKLGKDYEALTDAANRWKSLSRANAAEQDALVTAEPDVRFEELMRAEAALRAEGAFPQAQWGIDVTMSELDHELLRQ